MDRSRPLAGVIEEDERNSDDERATTDQIQVEPIDESHHNGDEHDSAMARFEAQDVEPKFSYRHVERETALSWWLNALALRKIKISRGLWKRIHEEVPSQSLPDVSEKQ